MWYQSSTTKILQVVLMILSRELCSWNRSCADIYQYDKVDFYNREKSFDTEVEHLMYPLWFFNTLFKKIAS